MLTGIEKIRDLRLSCRMQEQSEFTSTSNYHKTLMDMIAIQEDKNAFVKLFKIMAPKVKSFMLRGGAPEATADDLTQEVMLKVWRHAKKYDATKAAVSTWIFTIARNARIELFRKESRPEIDLEDPALKPAPLMPADDSVDLAKQSDILRHAIETLPASQIEVLRLSYYSGLSHTEIAAKICIPSGTVKSRLRLATERLRLNLKEFA